MDDKQLIDDILKGEDDSFRLLVEKYRRKIFAICYGFVQQKEDAYDLAQDVFVEVYQSLNKFRHDAMFSTWLFRIAVNKSLNHLRKNKKSRFAGSFDNIDGQYLMEVLNAESKERADNDFIDEERRRIIYAAIEKLPKSQKIAFSMHNINEISYKQIAETMGLSLAAVESLIHRAKIKLQKILIHYYRDKL